MDPESDTRSSDSATTSIKVVSEVDNSNKRLKLNENDANLASSKPDVFRIPHSRMRELVTWPLKEAASVPDVQDLQPSLQAVYEAMWELKSHEIIENEYIMEILKARLQARQVNKPMCLHNAC
jgi:hypothetical protein